MSLSTLRDKGAVVKYGGGIIKVREVADDGSGASGTGIDLGYIQETTFADITEDEEIIDETGNLVNVLESNRTVRLTGVLMQSDKATLDIAKRCRNKYYQVYYLMNTSVNGKKQELLMGICRIKPAVELPSNTRRIPIEIKCLKNENAITGVNLVTSYGGYATSVTITAGDYYVIAET